MHHTGLVVLCIEALAVACTAGATPHFRETFFVGGEYVEDGDGGHVIEGQMYVEHLTPASDQTQPYPVIFIHGATRTGIVSISKGGRNHKPCHPRATEYICTNQSLLILGLAHKARRPARLGRTLPRPRVRVLPSRPTVPRTQRSRAHDAARPPLQRRVRGAAVHGAGEVRALAASGAAHAVAGPHRPHGGPRLRPAARVRQLPGR